MARQMEVWVAQTYQQLETARVDPLPELLAGPEVVRDRMAETQRKTEVVSHLLTETLRRTAHSRARERALAAQIAILRRSGGAEASTLDAHREAQDDSDALRCLASALRAHRDQLRAAAQNIRALTKLMTDAMAAPHPGVREDPLREITRQDPVGVEFSDRQIATLLGPDVELAVNVEELLHGREEY